MLKCFFCHCRSVVLVLKLYINGAGHILTILYLASFNELQDFCFIVCSCVLPLLLHDQVNILPLSYHKPCPFFLLNPIPLCECSMACCFPLSGFLGCFKFRAIQRIALLRIFCENSFQLAKQKRNSFNYRYAYFYKGCQFSKGIVFTAPIGSK